MTNRISLLLLMAGIGLFANAAESSLFARLGGRPVVEKVVAQTLAKVAADPAVNKSFDGVELKPLGGKITDQICSLSGGGCRYEGDSMKDVHAGMDITEKEFYVLVEALREALDSNGVGAREKNELLELLAPMKRDVVTK